MAKYNLRTMRECDLPNVRAWRNDQSVRSYMYTQHEISEHEHRAWYDAASKNHGTSLLIFEIDGEPNGFVNFNRLRSGPVAEWGFYLSPGAARGTGRLLGEAALNHAFGELNLSRVYGEALESNVASIRFHKRLGFREEGLLRNHFHNGVAFLSVYCFGLLSDEWNIGRAHNEYTRDSD